MRKGNLAKETDRINLVQQEGRTGGGFAEENSQQALLQSEQPARWPGCSHFAVPDRDLGLGCGSRSYLLATA